MIVNASNCLSVRKTVTHFLPTAGILLLQKIFVMPNMDDVWLPIMHSAMDTRSNVNLATGTTDALKDAETLDLEDVTDGLWELLKVSKKT